jgi:hypothetical protein
MMDDNLWDFKNLEQQRIVEDAPPGVYLDELGEMFG